MKYRVMLHPGEVRSKNDGDIHFIGARQLEHLYGVRDDDEVVVFDIKNPTHDERWQKDHGMGVIHLYPRNDGNYEDIHAMDEFIPDGFREGAQ